MAQEQIPPKHPLISRQAVRRFIGIVVRCLGVKGVL